jgi:CBS domain-containing protein
MLVAELMRTSVETVMADASVEDAIVTMADAHVSSLPVVDMRGLMLGVISNNDVLAAEAETGDGGLKTLLDGTVKSIMSTRRLAVSPQTTVREAAQQMLYADVHRLYVTEDDRVVGVVSTMDIVRAVATGQL